MKTMSNQKPGQPVFLNVTPAHLSDTAVEQRLGKLRAAGKAAKEAVHSQVAQDRQRRTELVASITDRAMRATIKDLQEE